MGSLEFPRKCHKNIYQFNLENMNHDARHGRISATHFFTYFNPATKCSIETPVLLSKSMKFLCKVALLVGFLVNTGYFQSEI